MLLNVTNHASSSWSSAQLQAAHQQYGPILDLPFPRIDAAMEDEKISQLASDYLNQIEQFENPTVLLQGEFVFTYRLICLLKSKGIRVVACQSNIEREEFLDENQNTVKRTVYRFIRFLEY